MEESEAEGEDAAQLPGNLQDGDQHVVLEADADGAGDHPRRNLFAAGAGPRPAGAITNEEAEGRIIAEVPRPTTAITTSSSSNFDDVPPASSSGVLNRSAQNDQVDDLSHVEQGSVVASKIAPLQQDAGGLVVTEDAAPRDEVVQLAPSKSMESLPQSILSNPPSAVRPTRKNSGRKRTAAVNVRWDEGMMIMSLYVYLSSVERH